MNLREHPGVKMWPPQWGFVLKKFGREHPNVDSTFNSRAILRRAYLKPYEADSIEVVVEHHSFEERVTGTVLVVDGWGTKKFEALLESCSGLTIEQIESFEFAE